MFVHSIDEANCRKVTDFLPKLMEVFTGPNHMAHYLGEGKDGIVFRMFNPFDDNDRSLDRYALKAWNPTFRARSHETRIQRLAGEIRDGPFRVPRVLLDDQRLGCLVMDFVPGKTAYRAICADKRFITESFSEKILDAFRALNKAGITHGDPHLGNFMFTGEEKFLLGTREVISDADIWIIDFGRSVEAVSCADPERIVTDLMNRIVPDPD